MEPKVSIITTTSNIVSQNLVDDFTLQINLLARQSYKNIEHIIIDGASTDGTVDFLKDFKNLGYFNFYSEPDGSKFEGYNKGLMRAKGKYVAFLSCDDFYHDITAIRGMIELMEEEGTDFAFAPSYCCQTDEDILEVEPKIFNVFQVAPFPRQALICRRDMIEKLRGFDTKFRLFADYDLILRIFLNKFRGSYYDKSLVTYRLGERAMKRPAQILTETNHIFYKNYKSLYPLSDDELENLVNVSQIPKPLLDKLAQCFEPEDSETFYEEYQRMYDIRLETYKIAQNRFKRGY